MTDPIATPELHAAAARLEEIARLLEAQGQGPQQMRDLADEALEIAQRVSGLLTAAMAQEPGPPDSGARDGADAPR